VWIKFDILTCFSSRESFGKEEIEKRNKEKKKEKKNKKKEKKKRKEKKPKLLYSGRTVRNWLFFAFEDVYTYLSYIHQPFWVESI